MTVSLYETGLKAYAINYTIHADDSALIYSRDYRFQNHPFTNINPSSVIPGIPRSAKWARAGLSLRGRGRPGDSFGRRAIGRIVEEAAAS